MTGEEKTRGFDEWRLLPLGAIVSTKSKLGLLPLSKGTFLSLIKRGLAPQGQQLYGRTKFWRFGDIKRFSENFGRENDGNE